MSDSQDETSGQAPGAGAGDSETSQAVPRLGQGSTRTQDAKGDDTVVQPAVSDDAPAKKSAPAAKKAPGSTPAKKAAPAAKKSTPATPPPAAKKSAPAAKSSAPKSSAPTTPPPAAKKAASGSTSGRTLTAADYARTTRPSAGETTSVMPAIKDEPAATPPPTPAASAAAPTSSRRARLRLTHIEPWSVTRLAFVVSVAMMIVAVVAVTIFWVVLDLTGVWDQLNGSVTNVLSDDSGNFNITDYLGLGRLVGLTLVISAINVVVWTALATIAAHLYNLAAQLLGGIEMTFGDD
ncbi:MAG: DUF3566 domain-containing protein [Aeromicrobium erythreum]